MRQSLHMDCDITIAFVEKNFHYHLLDSAYAELQ